MNFKLHGTKRPLTESMASYWPKQDHVTLTLIFCWLSDVQNSRSLDDNSLFLHFFASIPILSVKSR